MIDPDALPHLDAGIDPEPAPVPSDLGRPPSSAVKAKRPKQKGTGYRNGESFNAAAVPWGSVSGRVVRQPPVLEEFVKPLKPVGMVKR